MAEFTAPILPFGEPPIVKLEPLPEQTIQLSPEQSRAFDLYNRGKNFFVTGPGGTGKTQLIRSIYKDATGKGRKIQVCAMTGCAALLLDCSAKTVHSWAGIGLGNGDIGVISARIALDKWKSKPWRNTDILVIDEVSMMSSRMFDLLDQVGRVVRKRYSEPFGGIQVIFSGDFFQLPPVGSRDEPETSAFCFESTVWDTTFPKTVELTHLFRQTDDVYRKILGEIREGRLARSSYNILKARQAISAITPTETAEDGEFATPFLFPTRKRVNDLNAKRYAELAGGGDTEFNMGEVPVEDLKLTPTQQNNYNRHRRTDVDREVKRLTDNVNALPSINLKVGTQVMCVSNIDMEIPNMAVANGSQGIVVDFRGGFPFVRFKSGLVRVIRTQTFKSEAFVGVAVRQVPLVYAWAVSIHKSQGATMDAARLDIGSNVFEAGQTYVALSRIKSLDGLYIDAFEPQKIKTNKRVKAYYAKLRETVV